MKHLYKIEDEDGDWIGVRPDGTIEGANRCDRAVGLSATVDRLFGFVCLRDMIEVRADDPALEVEKINRIALEARAGFTPAPSTTDLKPRGVKRQWWLMPLDAWAYVLADAELDGADALDLPDALAAYQAHPCPENAALVACAFAEQIGTYEQAADLAVQVFEHGAAKYSPDNWRNAAGDMTAFRREYLSAMCRHAFPTNGDVDLDHVLPDGTEIKGSGLPHDAHGLCTALMVLWHEMRA